MKAHSGHASLMARLERLERATAILKAEVSQDERPADYAGKDHGAPGAAKATRSNSAGQSGRASRTRRELFKVAGAAVAGAASVAVLGADPVAAVDGAALTLGGGADANNHESSTTTLTADTSSTGYPNGYAFAVDASASTNPLEAIRAKAAGAYSGITAYGGASGGYGVSAIGGGMNGGAIRAEGHGTGSGIDAFENLIDLGPHGAAITASGGTTADSNTAGVGVSARGGHSQAGGTAGDAIVALGGDARSIGATPGHGVKATGGTGYQSTGGAGVEVHGGGGFNNAGANGGPGIVTYGGAPNSYTYGQKDGPGLVAYGGGSNGVGAVFHGIGTGVPISLAAATTAGPPGGAHAAGDLWLDSKGVLWLCTNGVSFFPLQQGGLGNALFATVSTKQYTLTNSDGSTWTDLDPVSLALTLTPAFNCLAILAANADMWTSVGGFNQDLGIAISGPGYPTNAGQPEAWKESGGFAGTFSPNAAFVLTIAQLVAGSSYTVKLQWKANKGGSSTIWAGAGPISGKFSPTRLMALLITSQ